MEIYKEIKEIAKCMTKIHNLEKQLNDKLNFKGIVWQTANLVSLNKEEIEFLGFDKNTADKYFVDQYTKFDVDDDNDYCCGYLYFKTDVPGQFVKVYFEFENKGE